MADRSPTDADTSTCGRGLAHHGSVIQAIARYTRENADVLASHVPMLDESDPASADEGAVYRQLVQQLNHASAVLDAAAARMFSAQNMAMGRHIDSRAANAAMGDAFKRFVSAESSLVSTLSERLSEHSAAAED
jgi:hypothetical protein